MPVGALIPFVGVYVEATAVENVAEAKIIAAHRWMVTSVEGIDVGAAKSFGDEPSSFMVIEQESPEALFHEWLPAVQALTDVCRYGVRIVPVLDHHLG